MLNSNGEILLKRNSNRKSYFITGILAFLTFYSCIVFGITINNEDSFDLDYFKEIIQDSPSESWKHPVENKKNMMYYKILLLEQLIFEHNFIIGYDLILYDIKPKLSGLKSNEQEESWGSGLYPQAWVICEDLRSIFKDQCNLLLLYLNQFIV